MRSLIVGFAIAIPLTFTVAAQPDVVPNLEDNWQSPFGAIVSISQHGNQVVSRYVSVKTKGFKPGDLDFTGTISGHKLLADLSTHYPMTFKKTCPTQWAYFTHVELIVSRDNDEMVGKWRQKFIHADCSETDGPTRIIRYRRSLILDGAVDLRDFAKVPSRPAPVVQRAERISLVPGQDSAVVGMPIHLDIWISGPSAARVVADRDYAIGLSTDTGVVEPSRVTILKGNADAVAFLTSDHAGRVEVHASTEGLPPTSGSTTFCATDAVTDFDLVKTIEQAPANGTTTIPMQIKFLDVKGSPTTGNQQKGLGFNPRGVGAWRPALNLPGRISSGFDVPEDECTGPIEAISTVPGRTSATVIFLNQSKSRDFLFTLTWVWVLFSIIGALFGTSARLVVKFRRGQTLRYFALEVFIGIISGVAVMLAAYAGMALYTVPANGAVLGVLMPCLFGLIGGYLGKPALDSISRLATRIKPSAAPAR